MAEVTVDRVVNLDLQDLRGQRESPSSVLQGPRALQVTQEEGTKAGKGTQAHRGPPDLQDHPPHLEPTGQHRPSASLDLRALLAHLELMDTPLG